MSEKEKINLPHVMDFENAPRQYHDDYHRIKKMVAPFEFRHPNVVSSNIWMSVLLYNHFIDHIRLSDIEASTTKKVKIYLMMELLQGIEFKGASGKVERYLLQRCSHTPLVWPDRKEFEKFELEEALQ